MYFDVELTEFFCGLDIEYEREKRDLRDNSKVWCLTNWKNGRAIS